jgi:hypothetical protein
MLSALQQRARLLLEPPLVLLGRAQHALPLRARLREALASQRHCRRTATERYCALSSKPHPASADDAHRLRSCGAAKSFRVPERTGRECPRACSRSCPFFPRRTCRLSSCGKIGVCRPCALRDRQGHPDHLHVVRRQVLRDHLRAARLHHLALLLVSVPLP